MLHEADLLVEGAYDECVAGRDYVLHTAAAFNLAPGDIEKELIEPAIRGTHNVLRSVNRSESVKRTVLTATMCSIWYKPPRTRTPRSIVQPQGRLWLFSRPCLLTSTVVHTFGPLAAGTGRSAAPRRRSARASRSRRTARRLPRTTGRPRSTRTAASRTRTTRRTAGARLSRKRRRASSPT